MEHNVEYRIDVEYAGFTVGVPRLMSWEIWLI